MSPANLLALIAFFSPYRIAKFLGLRGGKRRRRQDPIAWVLLTLAAAAITAKALLFAALHFITLKEIAR